jgi:hypothetical protein
MEAMSCRVSAGAIEPVFRGQNDEAAGFAAASSFDEYRLFHHVVAGSMGAHSRPAHDALGDGNNQCGNDADAAGHEKEHGSFKGYRQPV